MQPVTDRFLPNLPTATWAPTCDVSYDGGQSWAWLESVDGTVTGSATQQGCGVAARHGHDDTVWVDAAGVAV